MRIIGTIVSLLLFAGGVWARLHYHQWIGDLQTRPRPVTQFQPFDEVFYVDQEPMDFSVDPYLDRQSGIEPSSVVSGAVQSNPYLD